MLILDETPPSFEVRLSPTVRAPAAARHSLDRLAGRVDPDGLDTMRLLVSELVTNSVRHGGLESDGWIRVSVRELPGTLRVAVTDPGVGFGERHGPPRLDDPSGWGLHLVEQLADRWGVSHEGETRVWFEIEREAS
jgi:anti-sigma regulatory factor (Ser/Thr protein kinase)